MSVEELVRQWATPEGRWLNEMESKRLLQEAGIRISDTLALANADEVVRACRSLGYPMQVSALLPVPPPESVAPGMTFTVGSDLDAARRCEEILVRIKQWDPSVKPEAFTVREAPGSAVTLRIAIEQDPVLGRVMAMGFGRMAMEVFGDVAYRVVPLSKRDPPAMLSELKGTKLLAGYWGLDRINVHYVEELVMRVNEFVDRTPEIYTIDLDPIYATRRRVLVYDARFELRTPAAVPSR